MKKNIKSISPLMYIGLTVMILLCGCGTKSSYDINIIPKTITGAWTGVAVDETGETDLTLSFIQDGESVTIIYALGDKTGAFEGRYNDGHLEGDEDDASIDLRFRTNIGVGTLIIDDTIYQAYIEKQR